MTGENDTRSAPENSPAKKMSGRLKVGVFFLLFNIPFGLGGAAIAGAIAVATGNKAFWGAVGLGIYLLSWGMLGLGVLLAGKDGVKYAKELKRKFLSRKS